MLVLCVYKLVKKKPQTVRETVRRSIYKIKLFGLLVILLCSL